MQGIQFDYFRGGEAEQFSFYRVPKVMFTAECFKNISCEAKVLYGLMLDRMGLSIKNRWFDEENRVYIIFTVDEIMELLNCKSQKATKLMKELDSEDGIGLIEKKRLGLGKPNVIYVKNFMICECVQPEYGQEVQETAGDSIIKRQNKNVQKCDNLQNFENQKSGDLKIKNQEFRKSKDQNFENQKSGILEIENQESRESKDQNFENQKSGILEIENQEFRKSKDQNFENQKSGILRIERQEFRKSNSNNTDINDTDCNDTIPSYLSVYEREGKTDPMDMMSTYRRIVRENISYDSLVKDGVFEIRELDELVELMVEVFLLPDEFPIRVSGAEKTAAIVKNRFMKISMMHIVYVLNCLKNTTTKIGNIKAYMLTTLYNSTLTMEHYYQAQVGYDLQNVDIV